MHYILAQKMEAAILAAIQRVGWYVRYNEAEFIKCVREASGLRQEKSIKGCKQQLSKAERWYSLTCLSKSCTGGVTPQARYLASILNACLPDTTKNRLPLKRLCQNDRSRLIIGTPAA